MITIKQFSAETIEDQKCILYSFERIFNTCQIKMECIEESNSKSELINIYRSIKPILLRGTHVRSRTSSTINAFIKDRARLYKYDHIPKSAYTCKASVFSHIKSGKCSYCNSHSCEAIDHIISIQGNDLYCGQDNDLNYITSCHKCNGTLKKNMDILSWIAECHKRFPKVWTISKCNHFKFFISRYKKYLYLPKNEVQYVSCVNNNMIRPFHELLIQCHQENLIPTDKTQQLLTQVKTSLIRQK